MRKDWSQGFNAGFQCAVVSKPQRFAPVQPRGSSANIVYAQVYTKQFVEVTTVQLDMVLGA